MAQKSLAQTAAEIAAKTYKIKKPAVVDHAQAPDPKTKKPVHRFRVVGEDDGNGPAYSVFLNDQGEPVEAQDASSPPRWEPCRPARPFPPALPSPSVRTPMSSR